MEDNCNKIIHNLENIFPGELKVYSLHSLSNNNSPVSNTLLHRNFSKLPTKKELDKLLWEIACFLNGQNDTAVYSFFYRHSQKSDVKADWIFCSARLNRGDDKLPNEVVLFSYKLQNFKEVNKRVYRVLANDEFFKDNLHKFALLTKREKEIIRLLASGLSSIEIAATVNISIHTIYTHRKSINNKLNIQNFASLLKFAEVFDI